MVNDEPTKADETRAETGKDDKMLSTEDIVELLRQDADAFQKDLAKLNKPEELHQQFEQVMEQLKREEIGGLKDDEADKSV